MLCSRCSFCTQQCWDRVRRPADMMQPRMAVHRGEKQCRREGCNNNNNKKKKYSTVPAIHSQRSQLSRNHGNISHWWDFFFHCHLQGQSGRSRWNGCHSRNATLKGGRGRKGKWTDRIHWENKQSLVTFHLCGRSPNEICCSEIPGHISFKHIDLKRWLPRRLWEEEWVQITTITHSRLIFRAQSSKAGEQAPLTPTFPSGRPQPLSTPLLIPVSFQGRAVMESSPSDVCSSKAAGRVGRAAEQAKASPLQMG